MIRQPADLKQAVQKRQELIDRILESAENADTVFEDDDMPDMIPADPE